MLEFLLQNYSLDIFCVFILVRKLVHHEVRQQPHWSESVNKPRVTSPRRSISGKILNLIELLSKLRNQYSLDLFPDGDVSVSRAEVGDHEVV